MLLKIFLNIFSAVSSYDVCCRTRRWCRGTFLFEFHNPGTRGIHLFQLFSCARNNFQKNLVVVLFPVLHVPFPSSFLSATIFLCVLFLLFRVRTVFLFVQLDKGCSYSIFPIFRFLLSNLAGLIYCVFCKISEPFSLSALERFGWYFVFVFQYFQNGVAHSEGN